MKYLGLGYLDEKKWEAMSISEQDALLEECFAYDDVLRANGHMTGGEALKHARNAATLRFQNGKVTVTDGPYAETKEQLGGLWILDADDLSHAIHLMSKHPAVQAGPIEVRPAAEEINARIAQRSRAAKP
jgi:hypothetical protein